MKIKTSVRSGKITLNHNGVKVKKAKAKATAKGAKGLKIKTQIKAGRKVFDRPGGGC